ncbi:hypothetical protein A0H81_13657 [Grifola frondosa]|uniref:Aminotransferase class I/classII large domain-containing protein n=1 Tax=Grifola frondosa TaxID=5627 RepID=A0A1C7LR23_GRIFR|nr:hypothetical protein A0H81_13657 [Grifola frondosa]
MKTLEYTRLSQCDSTVGLPVIPWLAIAHSSPCNLKARARRPNPMKEMYKYVSNTRRMVSLANGDPHFSLYPIRRIEFEMASIDVDDPVASWRTGGPDARSQKISSSKDEPSALCIKNALQYTHGAGLPDALRAISELSNFYHPSPGQHEVTLTLGNADGITKCFRLLGEPGDYFLADEFAFPGMVNAALPHGIKWVPVRMDEGGAVPEELEKLLAGWDTARGRRPHVLYSVPCGQNPTGSTLTLERRKKIYAIAQKYDVIIIEDDPYYFLHYDSPESQSTAIVKPFIPSFLTLDVDGRVMRIDSFSKVMAPGMRLGWITCNPLFYEHLVSYTDSSTQHPHAFGQILVTELLSEAGWQLQGFDKWVRSLCKEYQRRRDFFLELFAREVSKDGFATAAVPEAGMFVWIKVNLEKHPRYKNAITNGTSARTNTIQLMDELFKKSLDAGLVIMPASIFAIRTDSKHSDDEELIEDRCNFLRATFAGAEEVMEEGLTILGRVLSQFFAN